MKTLFIAAALLINACSGFAPRTDKDRKWLLNHTHGKASAKTPLLEVEYRGYPTNTKCMEEAFAFRYEARHKSPWCHVLLWTWDHDIRKGHAVCVYENNGEMEVFDPFSGRQRKVGLYSRDPKELAHKLSGGRSHGAWLQ